MKRTTLHYDQAVFATVLGIIINALLAVYKLFAGVLGHSLALIADALESFSDIGTSLVIVFALKIARQPPDQNHPYGHGKAEAIGSIVVSTTLVAIAVTIGWNAVSSFHEGVLAPPTAVALWASLVSIIVKEGLYQYKVRLGKRIGSDALITEAWHHRSDALSSIATLAGIAGAYFGGKNWLWLDPAAALLVAFTIAYIGIKLFVDTSRDLMDEQLPPHLLEKIRTVAISTSGVCDIEKIHARKSGLDYLVEIHVCVDPAMTVYDSHALGHEVQKKLFAEVERISNVIVHIEPHGHARLHAELTP